MVYKHYGNTPQYHVVRALRVVLSFVACSRNVRDIEGLSQLPYLCGS